MFSCRYLAHGDYTRRNYGKASTFLCSLPRVQVIFFISPTESKDQLHLIRCNTAEKLLIFILSILLRESHINISYNITKSRVKAINYATREFIYLFIFSEYLFINIFFHPS